MQYNIQVVMMTDLGAKSVSSSWSGKGSNADMRTFNSILLKAVDLALINIAGESGAIAVKFYIDASQICLNPRVFEESLSRMFGGSVEGHELIKEQIKKTLASVLEKETSVKIAPKELENKEKTLSEFVLRCKSEFRNANK